MRGEHRERSRRVAVASWTLLLAAAALAACTGDPVPDVTVDFARPVAAISPAHIGFTATTFGVDGGAVVDSPADLVGLAALGAGSVRIHLAPDADGRVVPGALGGDRSVTADEWLDAYEAIGLRPTVVVDLDVERALAVLADVRANGHDVRRFVLGNEMDANSRADVPETEYVRRFREIAGAMRRVDPTLEIGGPAPAYFEGLTDTLLDGLLQAPPAERAGFVDFHAYGAGEGEVATAASARRYAEQLDRLRARVGPDVGLQVGEFNLNWSDDPQNGTQAQTVWVTTALATILAKGAGAFQYGDRSTAMGLVGGGGRKPSYWGIAMVTGADLFRPIGTRMVVATSPNPDVAAFASTDEKNVVLTNPGPAVQVDVRLLAFDGGTAEIWQSTAGRPVPLGIRTVGDRLRLALPAQSVTTVVLVEPAG